MKIRIHTLWRVPVFCALAGIVCYYLTIYLGGLIFAVKTVEADGSISVSADPLRTLLFKAVLFVAVLLAGGLWAVRFMTGKEIALSAGIATALGFVLALLSQVTLAAAVILVPLLEWSSELGAIFIRLTSWNPPWLQWVCLFAPFLFVSFGKGNRA